ncbi:MAG TPA: prepilin-type N-terminal cleavage/methylation domain-containing protein, partial [Opitutaceae bacterium]|nr:prepilin-type N-terminal cleavage/methylation domain-containing protein [Opitutaceae bacterium]
MTTITLSPARKSGRRRGFTLVEVLIGATLSSFILAGVLSTFLFLGRSGANMQSYSDMESEARRGLELFAQDVRQASAITWNSETSITLTVNATAITYSYDSAQRVFFRNGF